MYSSVMCIFAKYILFSVGWNINSINWENRWKLSAMELYLMLYLTHLSKNHNET